MTFAEASLPDWIGAFTSSAALLFVAWQIWLGNRNTAVDAARQFVADSKELWGACVDALTEKENGVDLDHFQFCLIQFLAHLEVNCISLADLPLPHRTRNLIGKTIFDYIEEMLGNGYAPYVENILDPKATCPCLKGFVRKRRKRFSDPEGVMTMMRIGG